MFEKRTKNSFGVGVFSGKFVNVGTPIFTFDEWVEDEENGWMTIHPDELAIFNEKEKNLFLRYSYDRDFGVMTGTLDWSKARHISNFVNHSCSPNLTYDEQDNIIAKKDIYPGDELTLDYGNFIVNVDQDFRCSCGLPSCRHNILKDDWIRLSLDSTFRFPSFITSALNNLNMSKQA